MNQFFDILDRHQKWLMLKGYDQRGLGLSRLQEDVSTQLKDRFATAVTKDLYTKKPVEFFIDVTGSFEREQQVRFLFYYRYTPKPTKLNLIFLRAKLNDTVLTWQIADDKPHLLPTPQSVLDDLQKMAAGQWQELLKKRGNRPVRPRTAPRL